MGGHKGPQGSALNRDQDAKSGQRQLFLANIYL
uniref:Uncharacterized protein n=1 Tax=Rhizophora mucronata TaxID=61149 RepID=A0A2P2QVQ7_RHIMU